MKIKKLLPYLFAAAISAVALVSSFKLADPELGISTTIFVWLACIWKLSGDERTLA
ncbi:hypothetical protein [Pedobacter frigidisoli]|uniref:hypothetical protein n=1 Tax=Pedobacter frigidisoli TaxID=2530455 RepID=UPI00292EE0A6|nr:hypothetical protein [Pedobacter frigidisoli]